MQETEIEKFILSREKAEVSAKIKQALAKAKKAKQPKSEQDKIKQQIQQQYIISWIERQISQDLSSISSFIPSKQFSALFEFLGHPFSGRTTIKQAFDNQLLKLREHVNKYYSNKFVEWQAEIAKLDGEVLSCYGFFQDQLTKNKQELNVTNIISLIDNIAEKAKSGTLASHIGKFIHPTVKEPNLLVSKPYKADGYLRTGNAQVEYDLHINAAYLVVYRFLSLIIDKASISEHLLRGNDNVWSHFTDDKKKQQQWQTTFDFCLTSQSTNTNQLIKQVYFPTGDDQYHLLSVLNSSGLMFALKERIDYLRYSDQSTLGRRYRKSEKHFEQGFASIVNITRQRFGGDHPKNISALNNKHQDVLLLDSSPPQLSPNKHLILKSDFYQEHLRSKSFLYHFYLIHHVLAAELASTPQERTAILNKVLKQEHSYFKKLNDVSNGNLENGFQPHHLKRLLSLLFESVIDKIVEKVWQVRSALHEASEHLSNIAEKQRILLLPNHKKERKASDEWFEDFSSQVRGFIHNGYKQQLKNKHIAFQESHLHLLNQEIKNCKRGLL